MINSVRITAVVSLVLALWSGATLARAADPVDLSQAVVARDVADPVIAKAATMVVEEIEARTGFKLATTGTAKNGAAIILGIPERLPAATPAIPAGLAVPEKAEAYSVWVDSGGGAPRVYVLGHDARGVLFGAGYLLRKLEMRDGSLRLDPSLRIASAPRDRIRGHQLGYREINNTWDAWDPRQFEQYIRDLAVFGTNGIELIPDFDENAKQSPHMKLTQLEMNAKVSQIIKSYGLDVWAWHALRGDVKDPKLAQSELARSSMVFQSLPELDKVFIPGGDPGDTAPSDLMPFLEKLVKALHESHPNAELWLSTQGFEPEQNDWFFNYLQTEKPKWLTGVIFGPWAKMGLKEIRERTPKEYHVRTYPDITHCVRCQFPVPSWDRAFAHTLGREPINPRPIAEAHIHSLELDYSEGFVSYSDGTNDDVNKEVWTSVAWNPKADIKEVLQDYARYFIGPDFAGDGAEGILALENNWKGPLLGNKTVDSTLALWQSMEKRADAKTLASWRFQQLLYRAYYDAYEKARLTQEADAEAKAYTELAKVATAGPEAAMDAARKALAMYDGKPPAPELKARVEELAGILFKSIGMQLSVEKYGASGKERGATLDGLDNPLNDRYWLLSQFAEISKLSDEGARRARVEALVNWENPVPGSFYDDLGNAQKEPHLVHQKTWEQDPGFIQSPQDEFMKDPQTPQDPNQPEPKANAPEGAVPPRLSWLDQGQTLYDTDLLMHYEGLDPAKTYTLRAVYYGRFRATMTLTADGKYQVHGPVKYSDPPKVVEFPIPAEATRDGKLDLRWTKTEGRGCQVAEVWLVPNP